MLGKWEHSDWKIDTSKSQALPTPKMQAELKNLASKTASQKWHRLDPDYPIAPGSRANKRRGGSGNGTLAHPWDRWKKGACDLCTDKTEGWRHKKAQHKCSYCKKKGHEGPFSKEGKPNKKCASYVPRPVRTPGDDTGGESEGGDGGGSSPTGPNNGTETTTNPSPPSNTHSVLIRVDIKSNNAIVTSNQDGVNIVTINKEHTGYDELMEKITPLVRAWEEENRTEEEE